MTYDEANAKLVLLTDELTDLLSGIDSADKLSTESICNLYAQESSSYNPNVIYVRGTLVFVVDKYYRCREENKNIAVTDTNYWKVMK